MAAPIDHLLGKRVSHRGKAAPLAVVLVLSLLKVRGGAVLWNSLNDDLLVPYPPSQHGPLHDHRYIRDCQALRHGNATHESWPSENSSTSPLTVTRTFVSDFPAKGQNRRKVYGHITTVRNPLKTFSVLEPGGPGGCLSRIRATVEETAWRRKCLVAQNGGYFNMATGECLGNVVSDGQLVQTSGGVQNAQFGIRKDGTLVFGYLSEEDVLADENPFVQLVSGVVWLLRNGEVYVNQSLMAECDETQKTGTFDKFVNVVSARTAVGHDEDGQLVLAHVDGQTDIRGLNLWEMAEFLKQHGVINAINLDGGGSATLVLNGTLASYPSDHCEPDPMWRCARRISTVMCVHEPPCQPADCSGHGRCVLGQCLCSGGVWSGPACDVLDCGPSNCAPHGQCTETGCLCDAGWMGTNCSEACPSNFYGDGCSQRCLCQNGGSCDPANGSCSCSPGYQGIVCDGVCPIGQYGEGCQHACQCPDQCICDPKTGSCNISEDSSMDQELARVRHCLLKAKEGLIFTQKTWIAITLGLLTLLLLSAFTNARLLLGRCTEERERCTYSYHPLQEMNGETQHPSAWEKEDHVDETWDQNETEKLELL